MGEVAVEIRKYQNAQDEFDDAAVARLGINRTDGRCLDVLDQHGQMTAGQLAAATGLSSGAVTTLVDRLKRAGYVRRIADQSDRRRVLIELTAKARTRTAEIWAPIGEEWAERSAAYTDEQLLFLRDFLVEGREFLGRHTARITEK
jgi:DNA-binding MarR family transcriptional regulator